jgi:bifunctional oligoribonuclease and PAP phosphatase NrnA
VVTDTGRFQYSNSSPDVLRLAADLLAHGVPAPAIAQEVFESSPFGYLKLCGRVLQRARLYAEERFVYSWVTLEDLTDTGVAMNETEKLIDLVRATRDADVAALFKEQGGDGFRVSLRSKGPSVGAIARRNGGGGHELAAGFTAGDVEQAVSSIRRALAPRSSTDGEPGAVDAPLA